MRQTFLSRLFVPFRDFLYPPLCFVCDGRMEDGAARVCGGCLSSFRRFHVGDPVWYELHNRFKEEGAVSEFLSCFYFEKEGRLQDVIHMLKYRGIKTMGVMLGREIGQRILSSTTISSADCLVPVPLHTLKRRERGYNQSEFIGRGIMEVTGIPMRVDLLRRCKYTQSQTQYNLEQRWENVEDAFEVPRRSLDDVQGKKLILVDDVITTGSTILSCARELLKAGADVVYAASVAVAE